MRNNKLYLLAKQIHRILVVVIVSLGLIMMTTGLMMRSGSYFSFAPGTIRFLHNQLSLFFAIVLGLMMLTGLYLYIFPYLSPKKPTV